MTKYHGKGAKICIGANDVSTYFSDISIPVSRDEVDVTGFGASAKSFVVGLADGKTTLKGFFDGAAGAIDEQLSDIFDGTLTPMTAALAGDTIGLRAHLINLRETEYTIEAGVGGAVTISAGGRCDAGPDFGLVLHDLSAETTTGEETSYVDFGASSTTSTGFAATLHCTACVAGTTLTCRLQDSTDHNVWGDVVGGGFTALTDVGSQFLTHASTSVKRYVRAAWTVAGAGPSATFQMSIAKR